jgi:hypothetical protein
MASTTRPQWREADVMSLITMSNVGMQRDLAPTAASPDDIGSFGQLLVAQIPSEALLTYTTLLAIFAAGGEPYKVGRWILYGAIVAMCPIVVVTTYLAKRDYGFIEPPPKKPLPVVIADTPLDIVGDIVEGGPSGSATYVPAPVRKQHHLPILPAAAATASMAIYGLTLPGSALQYSISDASYGIIAGCLAVGGAVAMSILAPFLGKPNGAKVATGVRA